MQRVVLSPWKWDQLQNNINNNNNNKNEAGLGKF